jgi:hypothetical protein
VLSVNERDRLRREIARRRKAATDKILRTRKSNGINLAGTEHDPRIDFRQVKNMGTAQLKSYLNSLSDFTAKDNTFRRGGNGAILSNRVWKEYEGLQSQYNQIGAQHLEKIKDIKLSGDDKTIGDRSEDVLAKRAHGDIFHRPYGVIQREPKHIASNEALVKLTEDMRKKIGKGYLPEVTKKQRETLRELLITIGNPTWDEEGTVRDSKGNIVSGRAVNGVMLADELTDHQFYVFYNYGGGASSVFMHYATIKMLNNRQSAAYEEGLKDDLAGLFDWATRLPRTNRKPKKQ